MREETQAVRPETDDDFVHAAHAMRDLGGHFASTIAKAFFYADSSNRMRLRAAFPDLFTHYFEAYRHTHR